MPENLVLDALDVASVTLWVCRLPYALLSVAVPAVSSSATRYDAALCWANVHCDATIRYISLDELSKPTMMNEPIYTNIVQMVLNARQATGLAYSQSNHQYESHTSAMQPPDLAGQRWEQLRARPASCMRAFGRWLSIAAFVSARRFVRRCLCVSDACSHDAKLMMFRPFLIAVAWRRMVVRADMQTCFMALVSLFVGVVEKTWITEMPGFQE
jgi:hypothetical protein